MADKIDQIQIGSTAYDIDLPPDASPSIASLTVSGTTDVSAGTLKLQTINAPTSSGGTTYGAGSSGQVLKSNGTSMYWASDNNINYYPIRSYTSGLQISSYSGSTACQLYVPYSKYNQFGAIKPAYSTTGIAFVTTTEQEYSDTPTLAARTTTVGRYYAIEVDAAGKAYVNVPWVSIPITDLR